MALDKSEFGAALSQDELLNVGPKDLERILKVNNLNLEALEDMANNIREWIDKQPHLPGDKIRIGQIYGLLIFLSFSVEKVKRGLDNYLAVRAAEPNILFGRDPLDPINAQYLKNGHTIVMPKKTPEDHRVVIVRMPPIKNSSVNTIFKMSFMCAEYRIWNDVSSGDRWIVDLKNVGLHEIKQVTPMMIYNLIFLITNMLGAKLKSVHIINMPPVAATVINIFKKLIKAKLAARVFTANEEDIVNIFPKECLPDEYGGEGGICQDIADKWTKTLQSDAWRKYFLEQDTIKLDLSKKMTQNFIDDNIFGVDGSFRKLCVD